MHSPPMPEPEVGTQPKSELPLVSIVVATYNGMRYVAKQLDSLLAQTYPNIEIVITDDASSDGTPRLLQAYAEKHASIRLLLNRENAGYVKNFETGMLAAQGDLIALSDQDDIWKPEKIERMVAVMGDEEILYCDSELIGENDELIGKKLSEVKRLESFSDCLNYTVGNSAPGHAMLIRRKVIHDSIPFPTIIPHDYWLGFVATFTTGLVFMDKVYIQYRQHGDNVFGALKPRDETGKKLRREKKTMRMEHTYARERIRLMYEKCPENLIEQKKILGILCKTYQSFTLSNNWRRMVTFFRYRERIMLFKHRSEFRKWLYCFKMFFTVK